MQNYIKIKKLQAKPKKIYFFHIAITEPPKASRSWADKLKNNLFYIFTNQNYLTITSNVMPIVSSFPLSIVLIG